MREWASEHAGSPSEQWQGGPCLLIPHGWWVLGCTLGMTFKSSAVNFNLKRFREMPGIVSSSRNSLPLEMDLTVNMSKSSRFCKEGSGAAGAGPWSWYSNAEKVVRKSRAGLRVLHLTQRKKQVWRRVVVKPCGKAKVSNLRRLLHLNVHWQING